MSCLRPNFESFFDNRDVCLFDMDGTVVLTEGLNLGVYQQALRQVFGVDLKEGDWGRYFSGRKPQLSIPEYLKERQGVEIEVLPMEMFEALTQAKDRALAEWRVALVPGFFELAACLRGAEKRLGLVTSTIRRYSDLIVEKAKLEGYFEVIVVGEDVSRSKPDPQAYQLAMERLGVETDRTVIFEDSPSGLLSARRAGAEVIQVGGEESETKADLVIGDYWELLK